MDRKQIIEKIQAMLKLQESTSFEGEAAAAAHLIDKLCNEYGISLKEAFTTVVYDEVFATYKRLNVAVSVLLNAVATFYDAKAYIKNADVKTLQVIGSEAQQIQVKLYYEYLHQVMERECELAHQAEKVMAQLNGRTVSRSFKTNFRKAFANKVDDRLREMKKQENRVHDDAEAVKNTLSTMKMGRGRKMNGPQGEGAYAGSNAGSSVSLNRQASGSTQRVLCGG